MGNPAKKRGHPDCAALDILGATVNTAFLMLPHVHARCPGRVAISGAMRPDLPPDLLASAAGTLELAGERAPVELHALTSGGAG